ncbi:hypothetical protein, partial [Planktotalea sp.]|uniref:hypothetical protein n=1 Tax=Planktotalea sp. TaxID=2029877 RepID=UPI003299BAC4
NNNLAFKSDLRNFLKDDIVETWQDAQNKISNVIVSIRIPCEQTRSEFQNFAETAQDKDFERNARLEELRMSGEFLQTYQQSFQALEELLNGPLAVYRDRTFAVDYALARNNPEAYVRRVAQCANLELTEETLAPAMANIEASLYRNKSYDLSETQGQWARQTGAQAAYERIKKLIG